MKNETAINQLVKARTALILDEPFFGALALRLKLIEDASIATLCTDGKVLRFNPTFVSTRDHETTKIDVCHEVMHCADGHPWRIGARDLKLANKAADYVVNDQLMKIFGRLPDGYLYDAQFHGMPFEQVYSILAAQQPPPQPSNGKGQGQNPGSGQDGDEGPGAFTNAARDSGAEETESNWKIATIQAANAAAQAGKLPGILKGLVKAFKETRVDWRAATLKFAQEATANDYTWKQPNKRYVASGVYLPALLNVELGDMVLCVDTSGSVYNVIPQFGAHMQSILDTVKPRKLYVAYVDRVLQGEVDEFEPGDTLTIRKDGGGGTAFEPVFDWVEEQSLTPACLIYLTDLEGSFPKPAPSYPVLWASTTRHVAPFGETIYIDKE